MKNVFAQKLVIIIAVASSLTACADYLSDNKNVTGNGKIGLPGGVNILNADNYNSKSRAVTVEPSIHTSTAVGGKNPIYFRYTTTPGIAINKSKHGMMAPTRGIAITTNNFYNSYSLYAYVYPSTTTWAATTSTSGAAYDETYFDEEIKMAKSWSTDEFWPGYKEKCAFFAYAPYHATGLSKFNPSNWPSFHYNVPIDVTEQNDLLVTKNEIPANANAYGNIDISGGFNKPDSITFDHACTAIRFAIGNQMAPGVIKKIRILNVYGTGDYNYETESWSNLDTLKTFTLTQDFEIKAGEHNKILNNDDNIFMMIPQKVPSKGIIEVTVNDGSERIIKAYIRDDEWKKGYTITYYLSTAKVGSSYVLSIAPASGNVACTGGTKAVTINSYKQTYYGSQIAVPWTASYTYDDDGETGTTSYNASTAIVPGFVASGNGSTTGESTNFQVAAQVARSKSWRSSHTKTLREAVDGSCDLAAGKQTANCYVVQAPGTYTFPLVYGNALNADGKSNDTSYGSSTFVDHNGVQINSPYIYLTNSGANVPYDACIVWQDAPHLVTPSSVKLTDDKHSIQFKVERKNICAGNSVIAVRDKDQNIMWSWHIWVTDHDMTNTIPVTNKDGNVSKFMEVPLGWCDEEVRIYDKRIFHLTIKQAETGGQSATADIIQLSADSTYTYGVNAPYYQWGRKDPFLPSNGMGNIDKPYYDSQYNPRQILSSTYIKDIVLYSYKFNTSTGNGSMELWNKGNTLITANNDPIHKTIFDPSPTYYTLPRSAAFTGFTTTGVDTDNSSEFNSSKITTLGGFFYCEPNFHGTICYFSTLGIRDVSGDLARWHYEGNYWSAGPASSEYSRYLVFSTTYIYPVYYYSRARGNSIIPTSE